MRNNKGQALVEFIIILPIFLLILISIVDFGNIILKKYSLENDLDTVADLYKSSEYDKLNEYIINKNIDVNYTKDDKFVVIKINKDINMVSPILVSIYGKKYNITTSKTIYHE